MIKRRFSFFLVVALIFVLIVSGCSSSNKATSGTENKSGGSTSGGSVTFALMGDIVSVDPAYAFDFTTNPVVTQMSEGLLKFDRNSKLAPNLAESWESPDDKTYIYHIRKDVKFHDGTPMTVEDVIFSMERTRDPNTASYTGWMYSNVDKIEKADEWTVKVTLKQPDALWKYVPATTASHVISKSYYEKNKDNFGKPSGGTMATGPFKFIKWQTGSEIVMEKNEHYWNKEGGPFLDKVVFKVIPEGTTRVTGLKTGQIHMTIGLPLDLIELVESMESVHVEKVDGFLNDWVAFNTQKAPFNDVKVRQAINYALDKQKILDQIVKGSGSPAKAVPVGPAMWLFAKDKWEQSYAQLPSYAYDLDKAKQLLASSSAANGFSAKILTDGDSLRLNVALALQAAVKPLGINLEIEKVTNEELNTRAFSGARDYDIIVNAWGSDFPDPVGNLLPVFHSDNVGEGGSNFANYRNDRVDELLDQQLQLTDDEKRAELMIEITKIIAEDTPWILIDHPKQMLAVNKDIEGYSIVPLWYWDAFMKDVKLK
jgi:peptide/nickel transport system substrate-binding protein